MTHADVAIWAAQLADMPIGAILAYLRERGYWVERMAPQLPTQSLVCDAVTRVYYRPPPFDAEEDHRP